MLIRPPAPPGAEEVIDVDEGRERRNRRADRDHVGLYHECRRGNSRKRATHLGMV